MKIYTVLQEQFTDGNFGDLEYSISTFHGVFSSRELAEKYIATVTVAKFYAQFGSSVEELHIIESELNIPYVTNEWWNY